MNELDMRRQLQEDGFCIFPAVLTEDELSRARDALDRGVQSARERGTTHVVGLDPNEANVRINLLPAIDPVFVELLMRDDALASAAAVLGPHFIISNFSANIALPGSGSMMLHCDQSHVVPAPWTEAWAMNVIWCLDDVNEANGATRYLPGSHRFQSRDSLPEDALERTLPFEAPAGSFIAMEGRLWHTSGYNVTRNTQRRMMFAYYSSDFLRTEINWSVALPADVQAGMDEHTKQRFGLTLMGNTRLAIENSMTIPAL